MNLPPILLVGGGRMGSALLSGWRRQPMAGIIVVDPAPDAAALAGPNISVVGSVVDIPESFVPQAVVLAVKPQIAESAIPPLAPFCAKAVVISIMAGQTVARIAAALGRHAIVRAMPNTPAAIGQGFTAAFAAPGVSPVQRDLSDAMLSAVGEVAWVENEAAMDAVTATSGSGPAYVFLLTELLAAAAIEQGLPPDLARRLARQTVAGSGTLLASSGEDPAAMRRAVTSPGGTTERALAVLMAADAWPSAVSRAVAAATARSRELSS